MKSKKLSQFAPSQTIKWPPVVSGPPERIKAPDVEQASPGTVSCANAAGIMGNVKKTTTSPRKTATSQFSRTQ
jgi:hypothetical protein